MKTDTIRVEDMHCGHCEIAVQEAVRKLPGVTKAKASKRKQQAVVEYDETLTTLGQIVDAVNQTGYKAFADAQ